MMRRGLAAEPALMLLMLAALLALPGPALAERPSGGAAQASLGRRGVSMKHSVSHVRINDSPTPIAQAPHTVDDNGLPDVAATDSRADANAVCELAKSVDNVVVCSREGFRSGAWQSALFVECQLLRASQAQDVVTSLLERLERDDQHDDYAVARDVNASTLPGKPRFDRMEPCPASCGACLGQRYFQAGDGKQYLLLPQPSSTGSAYSYDGHSSRVLSSLREVKHVDRYRVDRALRYVSRLPALGGLESYLNPKLHSALEYVNNDPALVVQLLPSTSNASALCTGESNVNVIDPSNFAAYMGLEHDSDAVPQGADVTPVWYPPRLDPGAKAWLARSCRASLTAWRRPAGAVCLDVNVSALGQVLAGMRLTPTAYAMMVHEDGYVLYLTPRALETVFRDGFTLDDALHDTRRSGQPRLLADARDRRKFSGADFRDVLASMFADGPGGGAASNCSVAMGTSSVFYPKLNRTHFVSYCRLASVPTWGLVVASSEERLELNGAVSLSPADITIKGIKVQSDLPSSRKWTKHREVTLTNSAPFPLPWEATLVTDDGSKVFAEVEPNAGLLEPNATATLTLRINGKTLGPGDHSLSLQVDGAPNRGWGYCFHEGGRASLSVDVKAKPTLAQYIIDEYGVYVLLTFVAIVIGLLLYVVYGTVTDGMATKIKLKGQVAAALASTGEIQHPMVLISWEAFQKAGRLLSYEEALPVHGTHVLYSVAEVEEFALTSRVVFMSHQWTSFQFPDPTGKQYQAMIMAVQTLIKDKEWNTSDVHLWVDYTSIPQKHRGLQTLAINSLTIYAANLNAFVIVAPAVKHSDLDCMCDKHSYGRRGWCRAEQLSHILGHGVSTMYVAEEGVLSPLDDEWIKESASVFQGEFTCCRRKHEGMLQCDKELLVVPMLGLWAKLCQNKDQAHMKKSWEIISPIIKQLFPENFIIEFEDEDENEERELFGPLLDCMDKRLKQLEKEKKR